jgi:bifunctional ADP-heptose synthase (sugar kinase/adenylyltransferase)
MRILVIGDSCTDIFQYGDCRRLCPEAPVPVFLPSHSTSNPGMAANVAENLKTLGATVKLVTNRKKITKSRLIDEKSNQMLLRIDQGDTVPRIRGLKRIKFTQYQAVVVSDYDKGFLQTEDLEHISRFAPLCFLDTKKKLGPWAENFTFVKVNESEFAASSWPQMNNLIVTLGKNGARYGARNYPVLGSSVIDIAGAGDVFLASFAYIYTQTGNVDEAMKVANKNASASVKQRGICKIQQHSNRTK